MINTLQHRKEILFFIFSFSFFLFSIGISVSATEGNQPEGLVPEEAPTEIVSEEVVETEEDAQEQEEVPQTGSLSAEAISVACDPDADLSGSIVDGNKIEITNSSDSCSYDVGIASYKKFDETVDTQELFDYETGIVEEESVIELAIDVPSCAYQIDAFYGDVIELLGEGRDGLYGDRKIDFGHHNGTNYCGEVIDYSVCQLDASGDDILVFFGETLRSDKAQSNAEGSVLSENIPAGTYEVTLQSYDDHSGKLGQTDQTQEQWYVELSDDSSVVSQTSAISDLPDADNSITEQVDSSLVIASDVTKVQTKHAAYPDSNPHSVKPVCALFEKIKEDPKSEVGYCPLEAKEGRIIVDFSTKDLRFRSDQTTDKAERLFEELNIPTGTYDVTLVGADAYESRVDVTQPNESYFAELFSGTSVVATTGMLDDLTDFVKAATSTTLVNTNLEISLDIDSILLKHSVYPDTSSPNSLNPVCLAFDKISDPKDPEPIMCPLVAGDGDIIVNFDTNEILRSSQDEAGATGTAVLASIPAGEYDITLSAYDDHNPVKVSDVNESVFLKLFNSISTLIASTTATDDVPDIGAIGGDYVTTKVASNLVLAEDVASVTPMHGAYPDTSTSNSVTPVCALFESVDGNGGGDCDDPTLTSVTAIEAKIGDVISYTLTADPAGVTFEVATSTLPSGFTFDGVDTISGTTTEEGEFTINITAINNCSELETSITLSVSGNDDNGGGGNGGGGNGGGGSSSGGGYYRAPQGEVLGATFDTCEPLLTEYLRMGQENDENQVRLLQAFLKGVEGYDVEVTGFFGEKTDAAVRAFQLKYASDILDPWGITESTGYVYYTTQKKINEIYCERDFPLSNTQAEEIEMCRAMHLDELFGIGGHQDGTVLGVEGASGQIGTATSTSVTLALTDSESEEDGESFFDATERRISNVAAAAFTFPSTPRDMVFYGLWLVLILALIYILGSLIAGMKDGHMSIAQVRIRKIVYFMVGTLAGLVVAVVLGLSALIVPLIIVIILLAIGLLYYSRKTV